jgi:uncharacterized protein (DUF58 family)
MARERSLRLTGEGKVALLLLASFALGSINTGTSLLYFLWGLLLNVYLLNLWICIRALRGVEVARSGPAQVEQGGSGEVEFSLASPREIAWPMCVTEGSQPGLFAEDPRVGFLGVDRGVPVKARVELTFLQRGRYSLDRLRLSCRAPFGLVEYSRAVPAPWSVLVLPATRPVRPEVIAAKERPADAIARHWRGMSMERRDVVRSLREHRSGDDQRAIHWRSSARRGSLVVKEFERCAPNQALVLLDLAELPDGAQDATSDAAVTLAASLFQRLIRSGERTALGLAGDGRHRLLGVGAGEAALRRGLTALALVEPGQRPPLSSLTRAASQLLAASRVFLVTTRPEALRLGHKSLFARAKVFGVESPADADRCLLERT